jgi:cell division septation protein DedD
MSQENVKPDQIQASVAAALSRLRGDLSPPDDAAADSPHTAPQPQNAPQNMTQGMTGNPPRIDPAQPANDLRAEPAFKPIPAGLSPLGASMGASMGGSTSGAPADAPPTAEPDLPRAMFSRPRFVPPTTPDAPPSAPTVQRTSGPLARMMNREATPDAGEAVKPAVSVLSPGIGQDPGIGQGPGIGQDRQPDLLAGLPPPPLGDTLAEDTQAADLRRRRNRRILVLGLAIAVVGLGFWFWNMGGGGSQDVPVITAEATPEKVKPADEGGLQVLNQNVQVLDNMDSTQPVAEGETVLPPPEQPVTPPAPTVAETQPAPDAAETDTSTATLQDVPSVTAPEPPVVEAPAPAAEATEPASSEAAPAAPAPAPEPTVTEAAPQPAAPTQEAAAPEPAPEPTAESSGAPEPQEAAVTPAPTPVPVTGNARIQLAAVKSEDAAQKEWAKLQKAFPDLLGSLTLTVQKVDKGADGVFYRIQAGPLADKAAAKQLCADLKSRRQDCLVAK